MTTVEKVFYWISGYDDSCTLQDLKKSVNSHMDGLLELEKQDLQKAWDGGHEKGYHQCEKDEHGYSSIEPDYHNFEQFYSQLKGE